MSSVASRDMLLPVHSGPDDDYSTSAGSYLSSETSAASTANTQDAYEATTVAAHLNGVEETIDCLYRLSRMIRSPSTAPQNPKASSFPLRDEFGNDTEAFFKNYAAQVVKHRCPGADDGLVERLARSITLRRKRFLYRRQHQTKLGFKSGEAEPIANADASLDSKAALARTKEAVMRHSGPASAAKSSKRPGAAPSATSASAFAHGRFTEEAVFDRARSVMSTAIYSPEDGADSFQVPPPPRVAPGKKEFECPYCCLWMPIKEAKRELWRSVNRRSSLYRGCLY